MEEKMIIRQNEAMIQLLKDICRSFRVSELILRTMTDDEYSDFIHDRLPKILCGKETNAERTIKVLEYWFETRGIKA